MACIIGFIWLTKLRFIDMFKSDKQVLQKIFFEQIKSMNKLATNDSFMKTLKQNSGEMQTDIYRPLAALP